MPALTTCETATEKAGLEGPIVTHNPSVMTPPAMAGHRSRLPPYN